MKALFRTSFAFLFIKACFLTFSSSAHSVSDPPANKTSLSTGQKANQAYFEALDRARSLRSLYAKTSPGFRGPPEQFFFFNKRLFSYGWRNGQFDLQPSLFNNQLSKTLNRISGLQRTALGKRIPRNSFRRLAPLYPRFGPRADSRDQMQCSLNLRLQPLRAFTEIGIAVLIVELSSSCREETLTKYYWASAWDQSTFLVFQFQGQNFIFNWFSPRAVIDAKNRRYLEYRQVKILNPSRLRIFNLQNLPHPINRLKNRILRSGKKFSSKIKLTKLKNRSLLKDNKKSKNGFKDAKKKEQTSLNKNWTPAAPRELRDDLYKNISPGFLEDYRKKLDKIERKTSKMAKAKSASKKKMMPKPKARDLNQTQRPVVISDSSQSQPQNLNVTQSSPSNSIQSQPVPAQVPTLILTQNPINADQNRTLSFQANPATPASDFIQPALNNSVASQGPTKILRRRNLNSSNFPCAPGESPTPGAPVGDKWAHYRFPSPSELYYSTDSWTVRSPWRWYNYQDYKNRFSSRRFFTNRRSFQTLNQRHQPLDVEPDVFLKPNDFFPNVSAIDVRTRSLFLAPKGKQFWDFNIIKTLFEGSNPQICKSRFIRRIGNSEITCVL